MVGLVGAGQARANLGEHAKARWRLSGLGTPSVIAAL